LLQVSQNQKDFKVLLKDMVSMVGQDLMDKKHSEREPGSIGGGLRNRVPKGMRMAGRTGGDTITIKNLKIVAVDKETNSILVKGAVPGRRGTLLSLKA
jgi:ribosomal protein L3